MKTNRSLHRHGCFRLPIGSNAKRTINMAFSLMAIQNLRRLLNHHEFVGHPLRKDYPVQKRQHLSPIDDGSALIEPLVARTIRW